VRSARSFRLAAKIAVCFVSLSRTRRATSRKQLLAVGGRGARRARRLELERAPAGGGFLLAQQLAQLGDLGGGCGQAEGHLPARIAQLALRQHQRAPRHGQEDRRGRRQVARLEQRLHARGHPRRQHPAVEVAAHAPQRRHLLAAGGAARLVLLETWAVAASASPYSTSIRSSRNASQSITSLLRVSTSASAWAPEWASRSGFPGAPGAA
jgi:hypothetical protein